MSAAQYRLTIVGPGDELLDTVTLDGADLGNRWTGTWLLDRVASGMGTRHIAACAELDDPDEDDDL